MQPAVEIPPDPPLVQLSTSNAEHLPHGWDQVEAKLQAVRSQMARLKRDAYHSAEVLGEVAMLRERELRKRLAALTKQVCSHSRGRCFYSTPRSSSSSASRKPLSPAQSSSMKRLDDARLGGCLVPMCFNRQRSAPGEVVSSLTSLPPLLDARRGLTGALPGPDVLLCPMAGAARRANPGG